MYLKTGTAGFAATFACMTDETEIVRSFFLFIVVVA